MEDINKMYLLDQNQMRSINSRKEEIYTPPQVTETIKLDNQLQKTLDQPSTSDSYTLMMEYKGLLNKYLSTLKNATSAKTKLESVSTIETPTLSQEEILTFVPTKYVKKASSIIRSIQKKPELLRWNERGTIIYNDTLIPDTNISDLINDLFVSRKSFELKGKHSFLQALKQLNIPASSIVNIKRRGELAQIGSGSLDMRYNDATTKSVLEPAKRIARRHRKPISANRKHSSKQANISTNRKRSVKQTKTRRSGGSIKSSKRQIPELKWLKYGAR